MATKVSKPAGVKTSTKKKTRTTKATTVKSTSKNVVAEIKPTKDNTGKGWFKSFFAKKYNYNEDILTIFKSPRIYGALIAEIIGVMLLTIFFLSFGVLEAIGMNMTFQLSLQIMFVMIGVSLVMFGISGANLNPIITAGMMATRRMSVIRGVLYILAQIIGAWLGLVVVHCFFAMGGDKANEVVAMPAAAEWGDKFWLFALLGLISAIVIGFFFARAQSYRKNVLTFAMIVGIGAFLAMMSVFALQTSFFEYPESYNLAANAFTFNNPAIVMMHQIFPTMGASFGEVMGQVGLALSIYFAFPVIGAIIGFYVSDLASKMSGGEDGCDCGCGCDCNCK